jgi:hypothetical protein
MHRDNHPQLRDIVNSHLGLTTGEAPKTKFEKAKLEIIQTKTSISKAISLLNMEKYLEIVGKKTEAANSAEQGAVDMVESYFIPLPSETINAAFARCKRESVSKLKLLVAQVKHFSHKDYSVKNKKRTSTKKVRATNFDNVRVERKRMT